MLWLAAAAITTAVPASAGQVAVVQARATVRIISGVRLRLDSKTNPDAPPAHATKISANGVRERAQLIEFE